MDQVMQVRFKDREVRRALDKLAKAPKGLVKVFRQLKKPLAARLAQAAEHESGPDGAWPRRAPATEKRLQARPAQRVKTVRERRRRGRSGPLRQTKVVTLHPNILGSLASSVGVRATNRPSVIARSSGAMAVAHNEGAIVGRGSRIPARPFVFFPGGFPEMAVVRIETFLLGEWDGK
jgi:phage gpG-like protein